LKEKYAVLFLIKKYINIPNKKIAEAYKHLLMKKELIFKDKSIFSRIKLNASFILFNILVFDKKYYENKTKKTLNDGNIHLM
jgi:hypothetical protein